MGEAALFLETEIGNLGRGGDAAVERDPYPTTIDLIPTCDFPHVQQRGGLSLLAALWALFFFLPLYFLGLRLNRKLHLGRGP